MDDLDVNEALTLAACCRVARNYQGGVLLSEKGGAVRSEADQVVVGKYRALCRSGLASADVSQLGFVLLSQPEAAELVSRDQADAILRDVVQPLDTDGGWQRRNGRGGSSVGAGEGVPGTQRKTFGAELDCKYRVTEMSSMPPLLDALGARILSFCRSRRWPFSRGMVAPAGAHFDQAYIQRYVPGEPSSTLGFHYDSFGSFGELICGVTLTGSALLLLRKNCGPADVGDFVNRPQSTMADPRTHCVRLTPLSIYCMTGLSRYDLRHAVVCDHPTEERISITFRIVDWSRAKLPRELRAATLPPTRPGVVSLPVDGQPSANGEASSVATFASSTGRKRRRSGSGPSWVGGLTSDSGTKEEAVADDADDEGAEAAWAVVETARSTQAATPTAEWDSLHSPLGRQQARALPRALSEDDSMESSGLNDALDHASASCAHTLCGALEERDLDVGGCSQEF